ncbi:hypothetical protein LCGC14_0207790 [marine sediment metagenome]|uniref:Uncharacterized protein n=1 Tax=marine sediment metagenome TaxID=412755 RepID=A0A0F9XJQ1_9ZZZZ
MSRHFKSFIEDTYLDLEDNWVIHRYRHMGRQWNAGARHKHINDARCTEANSVDSVYAYCNYDFKEGWSCQVCGESAPDQVIGMQELVWYGNRCENEET